MLLGRRDIPSDNYDCIVIGSGLGGMTCANKLAKDGKKVLLLEAHNKLGGFATWFFRAKKQQVFDVSLHGFPVGMKKTCRKYWSKEIADSIIQITDIRFDNPQFQITTSFTRDDYTKKLIENFGLQEQTVEDFFKHLAQMNFYDDDGSTNQDLFDRFFPNRPDVVRFLLEPITYANGSTLEDPAISYGIVFSNFMSKGVFTFDGGTDVLISQMKDELLKNKVDIKLNTPVEEILVENNRACGVRIKNGESHATLRSHSVVSNANIKSTIEKLVGSEHFSSDFQNASSKVRLNTSSCQVYIGLRPNETITPIGDLFFTSTAQTFNTDEILAKDVTSRTFSVYYPHTRKHWDFPLTTIVSSTNARFEDWATLTDAEYEAAKNVLIEDTLIALEKYLPNIRKQIEILDCATPRTIKRYTHHPQGTSFGTKFEGLPVSMNLHKELPGLFHCGSVGIIMSGWLGAANYGVIQANEVERYLGEMNS